MKRLLLLLAACSHEHDRGPPPPLHTALWDAVELATPPGISDLALDDRGHLWAIAERDRVVVEMQPDGTGLVRHPLDGVPAGLDTEALAYLGDGRFAIGFEGAQTPVAGVMYAVLENDHLVIKGTRELTNAEVGVQLVVNHGVEGICGHGDDVIAAIETVGNDGSRWAPLVWLHGDKIASVTKLRLTSDVGKISALACHWQPDGTVDLRAVERHYSVSRLLKATLAPGQTELRPT
ncbi:MAG: SdiA-regulated domain-containing protein, partial [Deltaproteobacteria bacterium]|nr:SdiA-regulated domain-containing protein [Deltaproteobacteria bacterium]